MIVTRKDKSNRWTMGFGKSIFSNCVDMVFHPCLSSPPLSSPDVSFAGFLLKGCRFIDYSRSGGPFSTSVARVAFCPSFHVYTGYVATRVYIRVSLCTHPSYSRITVVGGKPPWPRTRSREREPAGVRRDNSLASPQNQPTTLRGSFTLRYPGPFSRR